MVETNTNTPEDPTSLSVAHSASTGRPRWVALDDITINLDRIAWTERHRSGSVAIFFSALSGSSANGYGDMIEIPEEMGARLLNFLDTIAVVI